MSDTTLDALVELTRALGQPDQDLVIIGEGNTSCRSGDDTFWVKASGQQMRTIQSDGFVEMQLSPLLELLDHLPTTTAEAEQRILDAAVTANEPRKPSVEVTFHAALLADTGARYVVHTHPTSINQVLCSTRAEQFAVNRRFPDEVVLCGPQSVYVPYVDPGLPLALTIRQRVHDYMAQHQEAPKVIMLANHGLIVLANTPTEAWNITQMCVKAARIFAGACAVGEPISLSTEDVQHIYRRPDEIYRRQQFTGPVTPNM